MKFVHVTSASNQEFMVPFLNVAAWRQCFSSHLCINEWRMVFRAHNDHGKERLCTTPYPDVLEHNLNEFIQRWKNAEYDG